MQYSNSIIESLLQKFRSVIGPDYDKYKNHVYRVFLNCLLLDNEKNNEEKYAIAAVFHDIGIWTDHPINYLAPSIEQVRLYLTRAGKQEWTEDITNMINWHHKTTSYKGNHSLTVEIFRKADWVDVSLGVLSFGLDGKKLKANRRDFPNHGFHLFLIKQITKNFFRHPLNPFPMFKK